MGKGTDAARELVRRRREGVSEEERAEHQKAAAKSLWANMTAEGRSAEMKRRRLKGLKKRRTGRGAE